MYKKLKHSTIKTAVCLMLALTAFQANATTPVSELESGDLIRGQAHNAVYYLGADGMRYVFPNDKTYSTWYDDFNNVKWLTDAELSTIQIGGNVTYKPGVKMIKINSDPKVYAVSTGGTLRALESETVAVSLYGASWNTKIDDVPDGFFTNYKRGSRIELASQYSPDSEKNDALSINDDKNLRAPIIVSINDSGFEPSTATVPLGRAVKWTNNGEQKHTATEWNRLWGTGTLNPGEHFTRYFNSSGTWHYYSKYDEKEDMGGALIVE